MWIVMGLLVGFTATLLPSRFSVVSFPIKLALGAFGGLVGGSAGMALGIYSSNAPTGFGFAALGAAVVLLVYYAVFVRNRAEAH